VLHINTLAMNFNTLQKELVTFYTILTLISICIEHSSDIHNLETKYIPFSLVISSLYKLMPDNE